MAQPLMPKATAVWLLDNTTLTFDQVANFCGLHELEVQAIADGDVCVGMIGLDPVAGGQLTLDEIRRCEGDASAQLRLIVKDVPRTKSRSKGPRYTPVAKRADKPNAIAWIIKNYPKVADSKIVKLIGTTKPTIAAVRDRTHPSASSIKPTNPILLGLCKYEDLDKVVRSAYGHGLSANEAETPAETA